LIPRSPDRLPPLAADIDRVGAEARLLILSFGALVTLAALAGTGAAVVRERKPMAVMGSLEVSLLGKINAVRAARGLARLRRHAQLAAAAAEHSEEMALSGFFGHRSADGSSFAARVRRYYRFAGYRYWSVGENLIWSSAPLAPSAVVESWMRSPGHRAVLLDSRWRELGISAVRVDDAPGSFDGADATIVTADFGARR
jgi:uncharacterized protein YkwD